MGGRGNGASRNQSTSNETLVLENGVVKYSGGIGNLYRDLHGTLQYFLYENPLQKLGKREEVEYGIVGTNRYKNSRYNNAYGHIGYKIEYGNKLYITRFNPDTKANAQKYVREDLKRPEAWMFVGRIK